MSAFPTTADAYKAGYRNGFEAGRVAVIQEQSENIAATLRDLRGDAPARTPRAHRPIAPERKCVCGHVDTTHNDLGYCQASAGTPKECHCDGFDNGWRRGTERSDAGNA